MRWVVGSAALLGALAALGAPAAQAAGWSSPQTIATANTGERVVGSGVALADSGGASALVARCQLHADGCPETDLVNRPAGGAWQAPVPLVGASDRPLAFAGNGRGDQAIAYSHAGGTLIFLKHAGGAWDAGTLLARPASSSIGLALDPAGDAVISAVAGLFPHATPWGSVRAASASQWAPPVDLATGGSYGAGNLPHELAFDGQGNAYLAWQAGTGPKQPTSIQLLTASLATGTWSAPLTVASTPFGTVGPAIGSSATGAITLAWSAGSKVNVADRPAGGAFGAPFAFPKTGKNQTVDLAEDAAGDVTVVWTGGAKQSGPLESRSRAAGSSTWLPIQFLAFNTLSMQGGPLVSRADAAGGVAVAWTTDTVPPSGVFTPHARVMPSVAGLWGGRHDFASGLDAAAIDLNASGQALLELHPEFVVGGAFVAASDYTP
jgi:hypothetical protein